MTIKTHSHDSGMLQTRFAPSVNYEYQVNMCMDFSPQYRFAPTGPSTHWSLWGGTCGNKKNNPTGKLVETVEVLDMTPPVSTLWDVLPLLRRFPKTKKRISWVVISIEYKKPLHIYIYTDISQKIEWHPYSQNTHLSHRLSILSWGFEQWPIAVEILLPPLASQRPTVAQKAANLVISGKWFKTFTSDIHIYIYV